MKLRFSQLSALNDPFEFLVNIDQEAVARAFRPLFDEVWDETMSDQNLRREAMARLETDPDIAKTLARLPPKQRAQLKFLMRAKIPKLVAPVLPAAHAALETIADTAPEVFSKTASELRDQDSLLVFCCTEAPLCVPMWAHYAGNHTGFQIGFNPDRMFDLRTKKGKRVAPRKVEYVDKIPEIGSDFGKVPDFVTRKMADWAYEREWRFLAMSKDAPEEQPKGVFLFPFDPAAVSEITFGLKATDDFVSSTMEMAVAAGLTPAFFGVRCRQGAYGLERVRLDANTSPG